MSEMRAFRIHHFGTPDDLELERVPVPAPGAGEVLVRIDAASVNPVDLKTCEGRYPMVSEETLPFIPGRDFAGVVEDVGDDVHEWSAGDKVFGFVGQGQGCYAAFATLPAEALACAPSKLSVSEAAAVPLAALTAWQGLMDHGRLAQGERVLIHGASGGVGQFAVQFAKAAGAHVMATASGDNIALLQALGADRVIDYKTERFEDVAGQVDLVYDLVGGETQARSWPLLKPGGTLVSVLTEPSQTEASARGVTASRYTAQPDGARLALIGELLDTGRVQVRVVQRFAFDEARKALARIGHGHVGGKLVIDVRERQ